MTNLYTPAMLSIRCRKTRVLRASALASAVLLVACGGGDDEDVSAGQATTTTVAPVTTQATAPLGPSTSTAIVTTTTLTSGTRSPVSTTIAPTAADTVVNRSLVFESTTSYDVTPSAINGTTYPNALLIYSDRNPDKIEIDAGRRRNRFLGTLGIPDKESSSAAHQVDISLDGAAPVFSTLIKFGESKPIDLDVTGILRIRITVSSQGGGNGYVGIGNPRFA